MRYIFGLHGVGNAFSQVGTLAHSILEQYAKGELKISEMANQFKIRFPKEVTETFPKFFKDLKEIYYKGILAYFKDFKGFGPYKVLAVEDRFETEIDDWLFNGVIDLVLEDKDGNIIIEDHKSKSSFKNKAEQQKYARQLYLYAHYVMQKYGKPPKELIFNMFRKQILVRIPFNAEEYKEALQWAKNTVLAIREEQTYEPTFDDFFCDNLCDFRNGSCRFRHK